MGQTPTTVDSWAVFFDGLVNNLATAGVKAAQTYILTTPMSWLEAPVVNIFTNWLLNYLANSISTQVKKSVSAAVIDVQTNLEESAAAKAVTKLQQAEASGDSNAITAANSNFDSAMLSLLHSDGDAPAGS